MQTKREKDKDIKHNEKETHHCPAPPSSISQKIWLDIVHLQPINLHKDFAK